MHPLNTDGQDHLDQHQNGQSSSILRVSDQNGVSLLYIMLKIHHSGREPSKIYIINHFINFRLHANSNFGGMKSAKQ